ncbi:E3 ubiquitin-protein ligase [Canna indica]|uniref:E3 ubiquitin-protein ligase n=1 Tax=Canna indica TaxID=4628 RepID=A0AAQ3KBF8_9LILI|nr:E3 ubiquitin-protein ligase [Canna indica]
MGFPSVCYTVILPRPLALVFHLLDCLKLALSMALLYLGLSSSSSSSSSYDDYFFVYPLPDHASSSVIVPPSAVKTRLPVVKFSTLPATSTTSAAATCAVCLGSLESRHEVRELGNCSHAFHKGCIDKWVDIGQLTCPLCRARLLPEEPKEEDAVGLT